MAEHGMTRTPTQAPTQAPAQASARVPAAVLGPRLAAETVALMHAGAGIRLDHTTRSLALVDRAIDAMRRASPPDPAGRTGPAGEAAVPRVLTGFGAYTGEVLVRAVGATWVDFDGEQRAMFGQPFGIRTPDGRVWNPLGKALGRYRYGPQDSLRLFCLTAGARA